MVTATRADNETTTEEIPNVEFENGESLEGKEMSDMQEIRNCESEQPEKINKKALILEMLHTKVSLDEMVAATGWEEKSVRGVMSQLKKEKHLTICR